MELHEILAKAVEKTREKRAAQARLKELNQEISELESDALEAMLDGETVIQNMKVNGMTVYVRENLGASAKDNDMDRLCDVLEADSRYSSLVKRQVNHNTLRSFTKEFVNEFGEVDLPEDLQDVIEVRQFHQLGFRDS